MWHRGFSSSDICSISCFLLVPDCTRVWPRLPGLWERLGRDAGLANSIPNRIHAEFQLSEPPDFPFWFSPGQFTGHIILSKDATHIRDFRLFVPNHR